MMQRHWRISVIRVQSAAPLHMWCLQVADPTFFVRMIPMLDGGDDVGMVLSPQCFWNLNQGGDIFNHTNIHFW